MLCVSETDEEGVKFKAGFDELKSVWVQSDKLSDPLLGRGCAVSATEQWHSRVHA